VLAAFEGSHSFQLEPYLPNRFTRQFGFDQGLPEAPPELPRSIRDAGVGTVYWYSLCSRFESLTRRITAGYHTSFTNDIQLCGMVWLPDDEALSEAAS
jgi:hypothetical protein